MQVKQGLTYRRPDAIIPPMDLKFSDISRKGFGEPARAYLFHGDEDALKRQALDLLAAEIVHPDTADFDLETLDGDSPSSTAEAILTAASIAPLGKRRMVVVNHANGIETTEQEQLAKALDRIPEATTAVFVEPQPEMSADRRKARKGSQILSELRNAIGRIGVRVHFPMLSKEDAKAEARRAFESSGRKVKPAVVEALVRRVGDDIRVIRTEIDKVVAYAEESREITVDLIAAVTSTTPEEHIWQLVDAVGARSTKAALRALEEFFEAEGDARRAASRALAMIGRQLRLIWQMRLMLDAGVGNPVQGSLPEHLKHKLPSDPNLPAVLKRQSFNLGRYRAQADRFSLRELIAAFDRVMQADLALKGMGDGPRDPQMVLELLTVGLCGER